MGGHVVDRFLLAAHPEWPKYEPLPNGLFRASPEVARMLVWHGQTHPDAGIDSAAIFGRLVVADPKLPRGMVVWEPLHEPVP